MDASTHTAQAARPAFVAEDVRELFQPSLDDLAIGCECANPVLQIEYWDHEVFSQPLQRLS